MIRKPNNWNEVKEFTEFVKLPVGAYACKVKQAVIQSNDYGEQLCILFDIEEGEFGGYFANDYKNNQREDKKWKGVLRVWIPKDDGSEKDEITKRVFKGMVTAFENSNYNYSFDWNENSLVGKMIGILFRNEEWDYNGKQGWTARPFKAISLDSVRSGDYRLPSPKPLKNKTSADGYMGFADYSATAATDNYGEITGDDDKLPF